MPAVTMMTMMTMIMMTVITMVHLSQACCCRVSNSKLRILAPIFRAK
jgi:hypothetical protein